jgi:hypothetical protein
MSHSVPATTGSSSATGANGSANVTGGNGSSSAAGDNGSPNEPDFTHAVDEATLALLSRRALDYIGHAQDIHLWKLLGTATNQQRRRFSSFVGVPLPNNAAELQPLENAVTITASLAPEVLHALLPAVNSPARLERFLQWSTASVSVINFTATMCNIRSDAPEGWMIATAAHCSMIAD